MNLSTTIVNNLDQTYDQQGAIFYTVIILIFYSLSLFCTLILNIDPDDYYQEKKSLFYRDVKSTKQFDSNRKEILNTLADRELRLRYWRIYYGDETLQSPSTQFVSNELKRLSCVTKRMKEFNSEQKKRNGRKKSIEELNTRQLFNSESMLWESNSSTFQRTRSTSVPGVFHENSSFPRRSYDAICETPLAKPPIVTLDEYS